MRRRGKLISWWFVVLATTQFVSVSLPAHSRAQDSAVATPPTADEKSQRPTVVVVIGAAGTPEYGAMFREWAARWQSAAQQGRATCITIGASASDEDARTNAEMKTDRDRLRSAIAQWGERFRDRASQRARLWIVLLGHGTFDGKSARFNLQGPDISSSELAEWLSAVRGPVAVVDCSSSSGPFVSDLSAPERIIVTATKAGAERNFSRFGDFLSSALLDPISDLDKDDQVSLWEAYVVGGVRLREYYEQAGRLATEHPLLDDNGDRQGTPADWFRGLKSTRSAKDAKKVDGLAARTAVLAPSVADDLLSPDQRTQRDALEQQLESLKSRKMELDETEYYNKLEHILVELARLYREKPTKLSQ
ncbi:MAG: hypothetical protein U1A77_21860 [Pirellulales bacterium]